jgi:uncharacterized protein (TIGR04141 family)
VSLPLVAAQPDEPRLSFSLFLLRPDQVAKSEAALVTGPNAMELAAPLDGVFMPLPSAAAEPRWLILVRELLAAPGTLTLQAQAPSGLMLIRRDGKNFVITFGHAWLRLDDQWLEPDFGRRVALNSIARDKIVEVRAEQVFAKWHLASERAVRSQNLILS